MENNAQLGHCRAITKTNRRGTSDSEGQYNAILPQILKILRPQSVCSSTEDQRLLLHTQSESRQPVDEVCVPRLHMDWPVHSDQSAFQ